MSSWWFDYNSKPSLTSYTYTRDTRCTGPFEKVPCRVKLCRRFFVSVPYPVRLSLCVPNYVNYPVCLVPSVKLWFKQVRKCWTTPNSIHLTWFPQSNCGLLLSTRTTFIFYTDMLMRLLQLRSGTSRVLIKRRKIYGFLRHRFSDQWVDSHNRTALHAHVRMDEGGLGFSDDFTTEQLITWLIARMDKRKITLTAPQCQILRGRV